MTNRNKIKVVSGGMDNYRIKEVDNKQGGIAYAVQMKAYAPFGITFWLNMRYPPANLSSSSIFTKTDKVMFETREEAEEFLGQIRHSLWTRGLAD